MPPYKIHVTKAIWTDEDRTDMFDHLYKDTDLPFVPFIGLALQQDGWYCDPIERLTWNGERQLFTAESRGEAGNDDRTAEEIRDYDMKYSNWLSHKKKAL
jgi:hypothetical protein